MHFFRFVLFHFILHFNNLIFSFFPLSLPGVWREIRPHLFTTPPVPKLFFTRSLAWDPLTTTTVPKLIFLFPISTDGRRGLFPLTEEGGYFRWRKKGAISAFGILANHLASIFFLPLPGDSLGLLYVPVPHSLTIRSQSTNICLFPSWPGFVTWGIDLDSSFNGQSLAC